MTGRGAGCLLAFSVWFATPSPLVAQTFVGDQVVASLSGQAGDVQRGRALVVSRQDGLCILCHSGPFPEERFQGTLAPDLAVSSALLTSAQLRARIVDASRFNPDTIMPSYFRTEGLTRVAPQFAGKTLLTAQDIEDVVAFLVSLKP
ncbi:MAG: sulfur oxidation c-type cytochrome SoxX [Polaromonas sp.]|jgi:sulfur-oxidizing protein SoxX|nr:sulfur oxidation c-type cytochrome SoxX [Polaromonas sp.]